MSYIGVEPIPKATVVLTQGSLGSDTNIINVSGGYTVGNIVVYLDGQRLQQSDFTASDGLTVDLDETFPTGTEYIVEEVRAYQSANHYTKLESDNKYAQLSGGADANFTTMPQVGGDPIVESGSNSDGEWTRWADGTQLVSGNFQFPGNLIEVSGAVYRSSSSVSKDYPMAFTEVHSGFTDGSVYRWFSSSAILAHISINMWSDNSSTTDVGCEWSAFGRWK